MLTWLIANRLGPRALFVQCKLCEAGAYKIRKREPGTLQSIQQEERAVGVLHKVVWVFEHFLHLFRKVLERPNRTTLLGSTKCLVRPYLKLPNKIVEFEFQGFISLLAQ